MDNKEQAEQAHQASDILEALAELNRGRFLPEVGRRYQRLINAIQDTGKKGKIVVTLELAPAAITKGRSTQVTITPTVKIEEPTPSQGTSIFFIDDENKLTRTDPDQLDMFDQDSEKKNAIR